MFGILECCSKMGPHRVAKPILYYCNVDIYIDIDVRLGRSVMKILQMTLTHLQILDWNLKRPKNISKHISMVCQGHIVLSHFVESFHHDPT